MSCFSVGSMRADETEQAYALVRMLAPEVPPDLWAAFVANCRKAGELLGLRAGDGGIFGLASYRIEERMWRGRIMLIDNFWTLELSRSAPGRALLTAALEAAAAERGCRELRQVIWCGGWPDGEGLALRNHLALADPAAGKRFSKGIDCSCGNLAPLSTAEMYPAR